MITMIRLADGAYKCNSINLKYVILVVCFRQVFILRLQLSYFTFAVAYSLVRLWWTTSFVETWSENCWTAITIETQQYTVEPLGLYSKQRDKSPFDGMHNWTLDRALLLEWQTAMRLSFNKVPIDFLLGRIYCVRTFSVARAPLWNQFRMTDAALFDAILLSLSMPIFLCFV